MKTILFTILIGFGLAGSAFAQNLKVGYVNIELIRLYMPETKTMNQTLQSYQQKLGEDLQNRQVFINTLISEYQELAAPEAATDQNTLAEKEKEIRDQQAKLQEKSQESEQKLVAKSNDLLGPILEKLQKGIKEIAAEENYDYIFNTVDGSGVSILLHGPEQHDLTKKLMTKMGIEIPEAGANANK
ncbi:MAG: OmpH family outer membrane protein [Bacteroidota bacterium]